jgi:hypothetical protein
VLAAWQLHPSSGLPEQLTHGPMQLLTHVPLLHVGFEKHVEHFLLQAPQWFTSVFVLTQALPQFVWPCGQTH